MKTYQVGSERISITFDNPQALGPGTKGMKIPYLRVGSPVGCTLGVKVNQ